MKTPYWSNDNVELYCCDCRELLPELQGRNLAACITDPPFGKVVDSEWDQLKTGELSGLLREVLQGLSGVISQNGNVAMFAFPHFAWRLLGLMEDTGWVITGDIVWRKGQPGERSTTTANRADWHVLRKPFTETERICLCHPVGDEQEYARHCQCLHSDMTAGIFSPLIDFFISAFKKSGITAKELQEYMQQKTGTRYTFERHTLSRSQWQFPRWEQFDAAANIMPELLRRFDSSGMHDSHRQAYDSHRQAYEELRQAYEEMRRPWNAGRRTFTDLWQFNPAKPNSKNRHPCEKPVELMASLIELLTRHGDTVLDLFAGSGATGEAAMMSGRSCILCERDELWAERIAQRLSGILTFNAAAPPQWVLSGGVTPWFEVSRPPAPYPHVEVPQPPNH